MTQKIGQSPANSRKKEALAEKRAEALRENLRRRKDQIAGRITTEKEVQDVQDGS
ncbi:MAG: hypothetical protein PHX61_10930 [Alphaproteobacteria bacterium]|nr:hypothetical protein [Alphaproteobacteria bacterium]